MSFFLMRESSFITCLVIGVLVRPVEDADAVRTQILVLNFLSRINDGERLGEININALTFVCVCLLLGVLI